VATARLHLLGQNARGMLEQHKGKGKTSRERQQSVYAKFAQERGEKLQENIFARGKKPHARAYICAE